METIYTKETKAMNIKTRKLMLFTHETTYACCLMVESINFVQVTNL